MFCPNLLRKLSGTPWVAGIGRVFTHRFYQAPRRFTMIWLRLCRAVFFRGYHQSLPTEAKLAVDDHPEKLAIQ
jgi:hypothetical protein